MEAWTIPETITAGFVIAFALGIIYRFLGQRTDPKLLEIFELQTKANTQRSEARDKTQERLAEALDRNTATSDAVRVAFVSFTESIQQVVSSTTVEHQTQLAAIGNIPAEIMPTINTLTQKIADQIGSVDEMNNTVGNQSTAIQQILEAVLRLESKIGVFQTENQRLGNEIREAKEELIAIKDDVSKLKPMDKSKTPGVPVTPKPKEQTK